MRAKKIQPSKVVFFCVLFSYLKKICIPPNAKNSTPPTNAMVGKTFARTNAVVPFPLFFLCCLAKLIAFI